MLQKISPVSEPEFFLRGTARHTLAQSSGAEAKQQPVHTERAGKQAFNNKAFSFTVFIFQQPVI